MTGVPWELDELPRQMHPNPVGDIFGSPPVRKPRALRTPKGGDANVQDGNGNVNAKLGTISERERPSIGICVDGLRGNRPTSANGNGGLRTPDKQGFGMGMDVGTGTGMGIGMELGMGMRADAATSTSDLPFGGGGRDEVESPKKVQKGQIHALAKMLSALRR